MSELLRFNNQNYEERDVRFPSQVEVLQLNARYDSYTNKDEMVDLFDWDGSCWKTLFDGMVKEYADKYGMKQWDVFAALIHNFIFESEVTKNEG